MKIPIYQVDAFAKEVFTGNPAAVCILEKPLTDEQMQKIAAENNLAETAFITNEYGNLRIRWFTPAIEVELCGHATLATAHVFFNHLQFHDDLIQFNSRSGILSVRKENDNLVLNFPTDKIQKVDAPDFLVSAFDEKIIETYKGNTDYLCIFENENYISKYTPKLDIIAKAKARGVIISSKGKTVDFVSRFFAPQSGINEDPVTGSAHTTLTPYWTKQLNKTELSAMQLSSRKGYLTCKYLNERVEIAGKAFTYLIGEIYL